MKKLIIALLIACMVLSLVACNAEKDEEKVNPDEQTTENTDAGNTDENTESADDGEAASFDFMTADLTQYLKLGEYKGLSATRETAELSDAEFDDYMNQLLASYSNYEQITDRAAVEGETVVVDYTGTRDGVAFEGGTAQMQPVVASDGNGYIPGFGSALIGHKAGDFFSVDVTFPEEYQNNPDLAGVTVTFAFNVHYIQGELLSPTLDTIDDEFVKTYFGKDTVEEFVNSQREGVEVQKAYSQTSATNMELWQQIIDNSEVIAYPDGTVEKVYEYYREMYEYYASYYGTDYATFLSDYVGLTDDELLENCRDYVKEDLVMYSLVKELDANVTDEEIAEKTAFFAKMYCVDESDITSYYGDDQMKTTTQFDKVLGIISTYANITEVAE